jgi:hypothetical protein
MFTPGHTGACPQEPEIRSMTRRVLPTLFSFFLPSDINLEMDEPFHSNVDVDCSYIVARL